MGVEEIPKETLLEMYKKMHKIRTYEETLAKWYYEGKTPLFDISAGPIPGELHLSPGQESAAVGMCIHLKDEDAVIGTHRAHHFAIAKGVDLKRMTAEIFGKATGLSGGKGGHMHLFDASKNFSCSGIVGASFPQAVGVGIAAKLKGENYVAVAVGGDGAANQGTFHEALNLAALWKLPVIFLIEDNGWAISVPKDKSTAVAKNSERAKAYGIPGVSVDGADVIAVYEVAKEAVERARRGEGPSLIEVRVYRLRGHFEGDPQAYRPKEDFELAKEKDPLLNFEKLLLEKGITTEEELNRIKEENEKEVQEIIDFAVKSPYPEPEEALKGVFAGGE
ncbi:pyruvate dehydrogenase (acetyl-transferring) E1 component subunit alpha [Thermococci archaeon]|uniref:thiamine pyrophosphate-dependent dehydrogenase E1 component subunit alpha n=1 Tax=Palaeococcus sp. (in: euryarchaeotes) TaxID=2820298 RepID=UPI000F0FD036|nr:thiamine pyrophosphate-dependent dehydrogenase E1 component subunit alpha [Palaeococcus sp. (in: euryarchaeotes)]MCD6559487.1 thiamine pyrophosphate-dependent dehydrogenase E1 component subunit alpha [Palaeococcus sp. (in: euryarchaeotes)]RLF77674.1 MAG: pyruvate dehydrogenase (acetyl-transferring) E1 component subunit alpha [Thermococci archaeon]RLF90666.1 MAG: pyruvate dehydrogenase (acetyl-transferring) E1 component subunit alpha [Thermococci archaeon]